MGRRLPTKTILTACLMSFDGIPDAEIATKLDINTVSLSRWRKLEIWKDYEAELITAYKEEAQRLQFANVTPSLD